MTIVGAGLAGLVAAHAMPRADIVEAGPRAPAGHKALLRFRSSTVGDLTGVEFRPVTVHKGIWYDLAWRSPSIQLANMYSRKVIDRIADRSIWSTEPVTRWIAPEDFYDRLLDSVGSRVHWNCPADFVTGAPFVSTAPMPVALDALSVDRTGVTFDRAPIRVRRFRVPDCDVYQTVYYPTPSHSLYRASITGDLLICEFTTSNAPEATHWWDDLLDSFQLHDWGLTPLDDVEQRYGKIKAIDEDVRRAYITKLTNDHGVFSLGRFATWRNILLDDVAHDISVVKRLINASHYERRLIAAGGSDNDR